MTSADPVAEMVKGTQSQFKDEQGRMRQRLRVTCDSSIPPGLKTPAMETMAAVRVQRMCKRQSS